MNKKLSIDDIEILPKVFEMAERIDTNEAYKKAEEILTNVKYMQAYDIITEAIELLKALIKAGKNSRIAQEDTTCANLKIIANRAKEIEELANALEVISRVIK